MLKGLKDIILKRGLDGDDIVVIEELIEQQIMKTRDNLRLQIIEYTNKGKYSEIDSIVEDLKQIELMVLGEYLQQREENKDYIKYPLPLKLKDNRRDGIMAYAEIYSDDKTKLKKGSQISKIEKNNLVSTYRNGREEIKEQGLLEDKGKYYELLGDVEYNSPSAAASIATGSQESGWVSFIVENVGTEVGEFVGRNHQKNKK